MNKSNQKTQDIIFLAHGSPMNAIEENEFTKSLQKLGQEYQDIEGILMVSAHWMTKGTYVTSMNKPKTIHDFFGFPDELFKIQYPAPGSPELAKNISSNISNFSIKQDSTEWGLDHGTWSVLKYVFPKANIPVVQLSLDMTQTPEFHFKLGKELQYLRKQNILIMASGNIVHNLRKISWQITAPPHAWSIEFEKWYKTNLESKNYGELTNSFLKTESGRLSNPTLDHYLPSLYILGASTPEDKLDILFQGIQNSSISMFSFRLRA